MTTTRKYFMPEGAVDEESLAAFAKGVVDGTVEAFFKSEAVPSGERAPTYTLADQCMITNPIDSHKDLIVHSFSPFLFVVLS